MREEEKIVSCESYLRCLGESLDESRLGDCLKFYLYKEIKKRKAFSKLVGLLGDAEDFIELTGYVQECLGDNEDVFLSYARVMVSRFEEKVRKRDFSNLKAINYYFLRYFGLNLKASQMEGVFGEG